MNSHPSRNILGLDFGTANIRVTTQPVSASAPAGSPRSARLQNAYAMDDALPAALEVDAGRSIIAYGRPAQARLAELNDDRRFLFDLKPSLGQSPEDRIAAARPGSLEFPWTQEEAFDWTEALLALVLEDLEDRYFGQALSAENGWAVRACVPDAWGAATRQRLQEILSRRLHNDQVEIISDTGAVLASHLALGMLAEEALARSLLVFHLGALTSRVVQVRAEIVEAKVVIQGARSYTERYGGEDFDDAFARLIAQKLNLPAGPISPALRLQARKLKEAYSMSAAIGFEKLDTGVDLPGLSGPSTLSFDRADVESSEIAGGLIRKFSRLVGRSLQALKLDRAKISGIVITGGSGHWYFVRDTLERLFPRIPLLRSPRPDQDAATGSALSPFYLAAASAWQPYASVRSLLIQGRDQEAERASRDLLEWNSGDLGAHALLGYAHLRQGRVAEGRKELDAALSGDGSIGQADDLSLSLAHCGLAWLSRDAGQFDAAEREYDEALRLDPANPLAYVGLGFVHQCRNRSEAAERAYLAALEQYPEARNALRYLGKLYLDSGRLEEADEILRRLLALGTPDVSVVYNLGQVNARLGKSGEAERWFSDAIALQSDFVPAYIALGSICREAGRMEDAEKALSQALTLAPENPLVHHNLAAVQSAAGESEKAIASYRRALELDPGDAIAHCSLGVLLVRGGRDGEAETAFAQAVTLDPRMVKARYALARLYHRSGRYREAVAAYDAALQLEPGLPNARQYQAEARARLPKL